MKRVVITGMSGVCPIGNDWATISKNLKDKTGGVEIMPEWGDLKGVRTKLAAPVKDFELPDTYSRKQTRCMGRVAKMAVRTAELALEQAGLLGDPELSSGRIGVAYGSSTGSPGPIGNFYQAAYTGDTRGLNATSYIQMMSHTCAVNIGLFFGLQGRVLPTSTACTSGSLAIGLAYENIMHGYQDVMIAGGGEELSITEVAVFDVLFATSTVNDAPETTPRPFDKDRDGLVIGEGACTFVLEDYDHAQARGATILAEIVGFGYNSDGQHVTNPSSATMKKSMQLSLECAGLSPEDIGYVSAHATATDAGDIAESNATHDLFGNSTPVSSMKSYIGHTLGASGSLESWFAIQMMNEDWYAPTIHLKDVDERCGELDYLLDVREKSCAYVMNNNFAFGGINTSLIFKRV